MRNWCAPFLLCVALPAHALELGEPVDEAVAIHLTNGGLAQIGDMVGRLLPSEIEVGAGAGVLECSEDDDSPMTYAVDDLVIRLSADTVEVNTDDGQLALNIFATLSSDVQARAASARPLGRVDARAADAGDDA